MRIAALDIGGTAIKSAVYENEQLYDIGEHATPVSCTRDLILVASNIIRQMGPLDAIGISTRGQVNGNGTILFDNGPIIDYTGTPLKTLFERSFGIPVLVENDVNCAAWAEARRGSGQGCRDFLCVIYGTGIGGAIIQNGTLYHGANWSAGEFGAMQLFSQSPQDGGLCAAFYENLASASALLRDAQTIYPNLQNGKQVCEQISDIRLAPIVDRWVLRVSYGLSSLAHIFNPELMILGGGILQNQELFQRIARRTRSQLMPGFECVQLAQARFGNQAGMLGAALLAQEMGV